MITGYYPPPYNANAVRAMYLVKGLVEHGHDVYVLPLLGTKSRDGFFGEKVLAMKILNSGGFYQKPSVLHRVFDIISKHRKLSELVKVVKDIAPSIIVATLPPIEAVPLGFEVAKILDAKLIADVQDLADDYRVLERPWLTPAIRWYFRRVYRALNKAHLITTTTEFMERALVQRTNNRNVVLIPNGVDNEFYRDSFEMRLKEGFKEVALFLGDLNFKYHRLEQFMKALALAKTRYNLKLSLRVIGEGREKTKLLRLAEKLRLYNDVEFLGFVPREDLPLKMYDCLFGVAGRPAIHNPWILNTMRMTIYEYLSCGIPILAYGPPQSYTEYFIKKTGTGVYIPSDDPNDIAKGIALLKDLMISKGDDIIKQCRKVALEYDWRKISQRFVQRIECLGENHQKTQDLRSDSNT